MAKLNIKRVIESPDGNKEYLTLYTTLEEVNGLGKAFEIPNIGKAYYGIGEVTDPQASAKKRFNINGTVMAALKEVTTRYYSKYFLCDIGDNDIVLPPDAISVEYTLIGAGSGMAIFNNQISYRSDNAQIAAPDYNKFVKDINKIYPNGIDGGSVLSGSATKLFVVNADDTVKEINKANGGILEIYSSNLDKPIQKTAKNFMYNRDDISFDKTELEFKNTSNSNYYPGIINKLIGHTVSTNPSVSNSTDKELPIYIGNEFESLVKNRMGINKDFHYTIPLRTNNGCLIYNKVGPYLKTLVSPTTNQNDEAERALKDIGTNSAKYFKALLSREIMSTNFGGSYHSRGFTFNNDMIGKIPQLPKEINSAYKEEYTFNEFGINVTNEQEFYNNFFRPNPSNLYSNGYSVYEYSDNNDIISKLKVRAKNNISSNPRTDGFVDQFYKSVSKYVSTADVIGGKRIKFKGITPSNKKPNRYFDADTLDCDFTVGSNLKLDYTFYFGQLQTMFNETNDKYDFTNDDTFYKFNPFIGGCITGAPSEIVRGLYPVKGCKAIRLSIGKHGKIYTNKTGLECNDYFDDVEANGFAIIKINFSSNAQYTASDEQYLNNLKYSSNNEYNSYKAITKDKLPFYGSLDNQTCREAITGNKSRMSPKYTIGQIINTTNVYTTKINKFNPIISETSEDAIYSNMYSNENGFSLDLTGEIIYPSAIYNLHDTALVRYNPLYSKYIDFTSTYRADANNLFNNFIRIMESDSVKYLYSLTNLGDANIQYSSSNVIRNNDLFYINFNRAKNLKSIYGLKSKSKLTILDLRGIKTDLTLSSIKPDGDLKIMFNHESGLNLSNFIKEFRGKFIADPSVPSTCISNSIATPNSILSAFSDGINLVDLSMHEIKNDRNIKDIVFESVFSGCINLKHTPKNFNKLAENSTKSTNFSATFYQCKKLDPADLIIDFSNHTENLNMYAHYYDSSMHFINNTIDYSKLRNATYMYGHTTLDMPQMPGYNLNKFIFTDKMDQIFYSTTISSVELANILISKYNNFAATAGNNNLAIFTNVNLPNNPDQPGFAYNIKTKYNNHGKIITDAKLNIEYSEPISRLTSQFHGMKNVEQGYDLNLLQSNKFIDQITEVTEYNLGDRIKSNLFNIKLDRLMLPPHIIEDSAAVRFILSEKSTETKLLAPTNRNYKDKYYAEVYGINRDFELESNSTYANIVNTLRNVYGAACSCMYNPNEYQKNNEGLYMENGPDDDHILHDSIIHYDIKYPVNIKIYYQDYKDDQGIPMSTATLMKEITSVDEILQLSMFTGADSRDKKTTTVFIDKKDGHQERIDFTNFASRSKKILIVISNGQNKIVVALYRINYSKYVVMYDESCRLKWASSESPYSISFIANKDYTDESLKSKPRATPIPTNECTITFNTTFIDKLTMDELREYIKCVNYRRSKPVRAIIKVRDKDNWDKILATETI